MIPLIKYFINAFLYDRLAAVRWVRGFLLGTAGLLALVPEGTWGIKGWVFKVLAAAMAGIAGSIAAGQKNQTDDQIRAVVADGSIATPISRTPPGAL